MAASIVDSRRFRRARRTTLQTFDDRRGLPSEGILQRRGPPGRSVTRYRSEGNQRTVSGCRPACGDSFTSARVDAPRARDEGIGNQGSVPRRWRRRSSSAPTLFKEMSVREFCARQPESSGVTSCPDVHPQLLDGGQARDFSATCMAVPRDPLFSPPAAFRQLDGEGLLHQVHSRSRRNRCDCRVCARRSDALLHGRRQQSCLSGDDDFLSSQLSALGDRAAMATVWSPLSARCRVFGLPLPTSSRLQG